MSDHIPFHVQEEIMKRLPVKSLVQFRSVSKAWKSTIDSSEFIAAHCVHRHTQQQHLLVSYEDQQQKAKYVSYIDDDTFPQQRSLLTPPVAQFFEQVHDPIVVGSSHGLVCLSGLEVSSMTRKTLVWNPSIRKYIVVAVPFALDVVGCGVCPVSNDPKIVSITRCPLNEPDLETKFMVYTLSSGKWRSLSPNLPVESVRSQYCSVVTDGFICCCFESETHNYIASFDVIGENFELIDLPDTLARHDLDGLYIRELRESLAILQSHGNTCTVWMMEDVVQRSFTKLFTIMTPPEHVVGFRKSGVPIVEVWGGENGDPGDSDDDNSAVELIELVAYEPNLEHNNVLEISAYSFDVKFYTETLFLLGRSDCISY